MSNKTIPAISVIIPMYNAEKYIGECLDSILNQTFTDYEVIVVDDFSTDDSCKVVEGYAKKFNSKLQLVRSQSNSGGAGIPRNVGIRFSRGEYIFFMDADDAITETALDELYKLAQNDIDAEVIHCEKFYTAQGETFTTDKNSLSISSAEHTNFVTKPTVMTDDIVERVGQFAARGYWDSVNNNLFKRNFIVEKDIKFIDVPISEGSCFIVKVLCLAKKIIRVPNIFYVYRQNKDSITRSPMTEQKFSTLCYSLFKGLEYQDDFLREFEIFRSKKEVLYAFYDKYISILLSPLIGVYPQNPAPSLDGLIRHELYKVDDLTSLTAFLFSRMNVFNLNLIQQQQYIQKLQEQIKQLQSQQPQMPPVQIAQTPFGKHNNEEDIFQM